MILQELFDNKIPYTTSHSNGEFMATATLPSGKSYELKIKLGESTNDLSVGYLLFTVDDSVTVNDGDDRSQTDAIHTIALTVDILNTHIPDLDIDVLYFSADARHKKIYTSIVKRLVKNTVYTFGGNFTDFFINFSDDRLPIMVDTIDSGYDSVECSIGALFDDGFRGMLPVVAISDNRLEYRAGVLNTINNINPDMVREIGEMISDQYNGVIDNIDDREEIISYFGDVFNFKPEPVVLRSNESAFKASIETNSGEIQLNANKEIAHYKIAGEGVWVIDFDLQDHYPDDVVKECTTLFKKFVKTRDVNYISSRENIVDLIDFDDVDDWSHDRTLRVSDVELTVLSCSEVDDSIPVISENNGSETVISFNLPVAGFQVTINHANHTFTVEATGDTPISFETLDDEFYYAMNQLNNLLVQSAGDSEQGLTIISDDYDEDEILEFFGKHVYLVT